MMPIYLDLARAIEALSVATAEASRDAAGASAEHCDELLEAIVSAETRFHAACAQLRRHARPRSLTGHGKGFDRLHELVDDLARDRYEDEREDGELERDEAEIAGAVGWASFLAAHPELGSEDGVA